MTTVGLLPSFSQSSYFALAVGIAAALVVLWRRTAILPLALAAAVLAAVTLGVPQFRHRILGKAGLSHATGGRSTLVSNGGRLFLNHPLIGVGTGGFVAPTPRRRTSRATHRTPRRSPWPPRPASSGSVRSAGCSRSSSSSRSAATAAATPTGRARLAFGLALIAIVVHSCFYNALIEDPLFWGLIALSAVALREPEAERG